MNATGTMNEAYDRTQNGARKMGQDMEEGAERVKRTVTSELANLITDVEDLVKKLANVSDADVARVRQRVEEKLGTAKDTLRAGSKRITESARQAAGATDEYVHESPWQAIGVAALAGVAVGFLLTRR